MTEWLKEQDWYWSLYFECGINWDWLPEPHPRVWHVLVIEGSRPPFPRPGWKQDITYIPRTPAIGGLGYIPFPGDYLKGRWQ